jgi:hypothetical protein
VWQDSVGDSWTAGRLKIAFGDAILSEKNPDERWRAYDYEDLINRDKASFTDFKVI